MTKTCKICGKEKKVCNDYDKKNPNKYFFVCDLCFDKWLNQGNGKGPITKPLFKI